MPNDTYERLTPPVSYSTCGKCGGWYRFDDKGRFIREAPFAHACSCLEGPTILPRRVTIARSEVRDAQGNVLPHEAVLVDAPRCCASSHEPADTACTSFEVGSNGRCVFCDHEAKCHPGPGGSCWVFSDGVDG